MATFHIRCCATFAKCVQTAVFLVSAAHINVYRYLFYHAYLVGVALQTIQGTNYVGCPLPLVEISDSFKLKRLWFFPFILD